MLRDPPTIYSCSIYMVNQEGPHALPPKHYEMSKALTVLAHKNLQYNVLPYSIMSALSDSQELSRPPLEG